MTRIPAAFESRIILGFAASRRLGRFRHYVTFELMCFAQLWIFVGDVINENIFLNSRGTACYVLRLCSTRENVAKLDLRAPTWKFRTVLFFLAFESVKYEIIIELLYINISHFLNRIYYFFFFFCEYKKCFYNIIREWRETIGYDDGFCDLLKRK